MEQCSPIAALPFCYLVTLGYSWVGSGPGVRVSYIQFILMHLSILLFFKYA